MRLSNSIEIRKVTYRNKHNLIFLFAVMFRYFDFNEFCCREIQFFVKIKADMRKGERPSSFSSIGLIFIWYWTFIFITPIHKEISVPIGNRNYSTNFRLTFFRHNRNSILFHILHTIFLQSRHLFSQNDLQSFRNSNFRFSFLFCLPVSVFLLV